MREMKDSGVKTLGLIPSCWTTKKLKYVINGITTGLNPRNYFVLGDGDCFYVTIRNFRNGQILLDDNCDRITPEIKTLINKRSKLEKGNILFASISDEGRAYLIENSPDNWDINESVFSIKPQNNIDSRFLFYILTDYHFYKPLKINSTGSTFTSIKQDMLLNGTLVYPPVDEQKRIAAYLDEQCKKINEIMAAIQNQIDTVEDYKKSDITEAVTRGLNPNVEMKKTDIGWISCVPKHWKIDKIKFHLQRLEYRNPGNMPILSVYREYGVIPKDSRSDNHNVTSEDTSKYKYVKPGYLVINKMKAWQGSMGVSDYEGVVSPAYFIYVFTDNSFSKKYVHYLLRSTYKNEFRRLSGGIREGQWDLAPEGFENTLILIPPVNEQEEIVEYIDKKRAEIDSIIVDKKAQLETIENYKKSLIYEYVTGKKEVPENE